MRPYALLLYYLIMRTHRAYRPQTEIKTYKFDLRDSLRCAAEISPANPRTPTTSCPAFYAESKKTDGHDHRFVADSQQSAQQLYKIAKIFEKKKLVDYLQSSSVPIHMKSRTVEDRTITQSNIFAGGLMTDFDFPPLDEN